jgi:hypothetical protein
VFGLELRVVESPEARGLLSADMAGIPAVWKKLSANE